MYHLNINQYNLLYDIINIIVSAYADKISDKIKHTFLVKPQQTENRRELPQPDERH